MGREGGEKGEGRGRKRVSMSEGLGRVCNVKNKSWGRGVRNLVIVEET